MKLLAFVLLLLCPTVSIAAPINVEASVEPQRQDSNWTCWMTGGAMVYGSKVNASTSARALSEILGGKWKSLFEAKATLQQADVADFASALGLKYEAPKNPSIAAWSAWLEQGPIWVGVVSTDGPHVLVITALKGDGSSAKTLVRYNDPADGKSHQMPFGALVAALEKIPRAADANPKKPPLYPQIIHF